MLVHCKIRKWKQQDVTKSKTSNIHAHVEQGQGKQQDVRYHVDFRMLCFTRSI